jgi:pimeloyl-ACP methyl ester carboxylesterase
MRQIVFIISSSILLIVIGLTRACAEDKAPTEAKTQMVTNPVFKGEAYLEQWGDPDNPSVILVHGLGNNGARDWQHLAPLLSKQFHVITFDLPGLGRSSKLNQLYSPDNYARFVDWVAKNYADNPFILIGHSMGGNIALDYASQYPAKVKQLILMDAAGILHRTSFSKHLIDDFKPVWWMHLIPSSEQLTQMLGFGIEDYDKFPFAINLILSTKFGRRKFLGSDPIKIAGLAMVQKDFSGQLEQVTMPTLLIWGGKDTIAPLRTGKMLEALLPNATLKIIPESQHVPQMQTPQQLNKIVWEAVTTKPKYLHKANNKTNEAMFQVNNAKTETCNKQQERYYSGRFEHLIIDECRHVTIENAKIDLLEIKNSSVTIYNSEIGAGEKALEVDSSTVFATATTFDADTPILADNSRLDFAGVDIKAKNAAIESQVQTYATFSLCTVESPNHTGYVHGVYTVSPTKQPF